MDRDCRTPDAHRGLRELRISSSYFVAIRCDVEPSADTIHVRFRRLFNDGVHAKRAGGRRLDHAESGPKVVAVDVSHRQPERLVDLADAVEVFVDTSCPSVSAGGLR